ncbi:hypothetical protein NBRC116592_05740 [Colwellia sp. KU-HH00111]|uniref:hypothetical protein n=1 Tax=Colwellia sp. KU-HH00111 TaxID=3127652 RepID=UPI003108BDE7
MKFKSLTIALLTLIPMSQVVAETTATKKSTNTTATVSKNATANANRCGVVILSKKPPKTKSIHFASINSIDGVTVSSRSRAFTLSEGKHVVKVIENIRENSLTRRRGEAKNYKFIELNIQGNKKYALGAKYIRKNRSKLSTGEYWEPVVWKEENVECKLN